MRRKKNQDCSPWTAEEVEGELFLVFPRQTIDENKSGEKVENFIRSMNAVVFFAYSNGTISFPLAIDHWLQ